MLETDVNFKARIERAIQANRQASEVSVGRVTANRQAREEKEEARIALWDAKQPEFAAYIRSRAADAADFLVSGKVLPSMRIDIETPQRKQERRTKGLGILRPRREVIIPVEEKTHETVGALCLRFTATPVIRHEDDWMVQDTVIRASYDETTGYTKLGAALLPGGEIVGFTDDLGPQVPVHGRMNSLLSDESLLPLAQMDPSRSVVSCLQSLRDQWVHDISVP